MQDMPGTIFYCHSFTVTCASVLLIVIVGAIIAELISTGVEKVWGQVGSDRAVEHSEMRTVLTKTRCEASDIVMMLICYFLFLLPSSSRSTPSDRTRSAACAPA